jgi:PPOX class probable F420-dependent enzyme
VGTGPDLDLVRRLAGADQGLAVLATTRPDGSVHTSVVNAGVLDHPVTGAPCVGLVARGNARKLAHFRRTGRAAVVFRAGWEWVSVEGPVDLIGPNDPREGFATGELPGLLRAVFRAAGGTHDDWDAYDRVMAAEGRTAVFVDPVRITGNS